MRLPSLSEHELLTLWVQLVVLVVVARSLGVAMRRIGQPPVVGELIAGVLLGPSVLAKLWPTAGHWLVPTKAAAAAPLNTLGWIGVALLLVVTGFDTDLAIVRRLGRPAALVAAGGLLVPLLVGVGLGLAMPHALMGVHSRRAVFVLFIAVSLSISSLPVIAKVLDELGFMRRNFGQVTIAVGMVNDLVGWVALGIIAALGRSSSLGASTVIVPLVAIAFLLGIAFTGGQRVVDWLLRHVRRRDASNIEAMTVVLAVAFVFAAAAQAARSDAVLGAYIAGIVIGRSRFFQQRVREHLESVTMAVFAPLFFATAGLRIDLGGLANGTALAWAGLILLSAVASKVIGAFSAARLAGLSSREGLALAIGLNARGAVEVVIATVGLTLGVLNPATYTAIVLMAIVTSVMAPPLLRLVVRDWRGEPEEEARLDREESMQRNLLVRPGRLLLPSRGGRSSVVAARILDAAWPEDVPVTVLSVDGGGGGRAELGAILRTLSQRDFDIRHVEAPDTLQTILEEAKLGYAAIGLGAQDTLTDGAILSPVVDDLLGQCPIPMVIVRRRRGADDEPAAMSLRRALVPVAGTPASRTALELAYRLALRVGTEVFLTHVVDRPDPVDHRPAYPEAPEPAARLVRVAAAGTTAASGVLEQAVTMGKDLDVTPRSTVRTGASAAQEILAEADRQEVDLLVLGTTVRRLQDRPFLGHTVEHVLQEASATVVVVATPDTLVAGGLSGRDS